MTKRIETSVRTNRTVCSEPSSLYCHAAVKTRKRNHLCHITTWQYPKYINLRSWWCYNIDRSPSSNLKSSLILTLKIQQWKLNFPDSAWYIGAGLLNLKCRAVHEGLYCLIISVNGFNTGSAGLGVSLKETLCTIQDILQPHWAPLPPYRPTRSPLLAGQQQQQQQQSGVLADLCLAWQQRRVWSCGSTESLMCWERWGERMCRSDLEKPAGGGRGVPGGGESAKRGEGENGWHSLSASRASSSPSPHL